MSRIRTIKPGFFTNENLGDCTPLARLLFAGLWTIADSAGRLEDRPRRIRSEVLPYDDCDVDALLSELASAGFIIRYEIVGAGRYVQIRTFKKHQHPHPRETASLIPSAPGFTEEEEDATPRPCLGTTLALPMHDPGGQEPPPPHDPSRADLGSWVLDPDLGSGILDPEAAPPPTGPDPREDGAAAEAAPPDPVVECIRAWETATGTLVTRQFSDWVEAQLAGEGAVPLSWMLDAIAETGAQGKRAWKYTAGILARWRDEGRIADTLAAIGREAPAPVARGPNAKAPPPLLWPSTLQVLHGLVSAGAFATFEGSRAAWLEGDRLIVELVDPIGLVDLNERFRLSLARALERAGGSTVGARAVCLIAKGAA